ncbi:hypothetical protein Moror_12597 [Moniliophthora roreri MCA 2997]|uniref:Uncharacterized protein n=2 Tax=Moniliophthora roreri TaxID=221103 RepID=V2XSZ3_MONRO|nr:hypothetical protein Moror_12597 [Moniliophthora roreri MCA 2997]
MPSDFWRCLTGTKTDGMNHFLLIELALEIHKEAQNATSRRKDLICLAREVIGVAIIVEEKTKAMTEEERSSLQSCLGGLGRTIDSILEFMKGPIDENQFDMRMQVYTQELQDARNRFPPDNTLDHSLGRLSKLLDGFQLLLAPFQQLLVRVQPDRTESAVTDPHPPSLIFTPSSAQPASMVQAFPQREITRVISDAGPSTNSVASPAEVHYPKTQHIAYNTFVFGSNNVTHNYGNREEFE